MTPAFLFDLDGTQVRQLILKQRTAREDGRFQANELSISREFIA